MFLFFNVFGMFWYICFLFFFNVFGMFWYICFCFLYVFGMFWYVFVFVCSCTTRLRDAEGVVVLFPMCLLWSSESKG